MHTLHSNLCFTSRRRTNEKRKAYEKTEKRGFWNGELEAAYTELTSAEAAEKEIDRQQLAAANEPK